MKILYGITKSNFGGAQRYVFDLATEANKRGYDIAVLCGGSGPFVQKLREEKIRIIALESLQREICRLVFSDTQIVLCVNKIVSQTINFIVALCHHGRGSLKAQPWTVKIIFFIPNNLPATAPSPPIFELLI